MAVKEGLCALGVVLQGDGRCVGEMRATRWAKFKLDFCASLVDSRRYLRGRVGELKRSGCGRRVPMVVRDAMLPRWTV